MSVAVGVAASVSEGAAAKLQGLALGSCITNAVSVRRGVMVMRELFHHSRLWG